MECRLCPRNCGVDRRKNTGFCGMDDKIHAARASLHMWEEPAISGSRGSGTVFFSGCTLKCVFCQNSHISRSNSKEYAGKTLSDEELSEVFLSLQEKKANNINLVTPTHFVPHIMKALDNAKSQGLKIPVVYNTGSYENVDTLRMLEGLIDVYLPDLKYVSAELSLKYSVAEDYFKVASAAIAEMFRQTGPNEFFYEDDELYLEGFVENGIMKKGVIVRHLILPGNTKDSKAVIDYLYSEYGDDIYLSIMNQYTPLPQVTEYPEINRRVTSREYDKILSYAMDRGIKNAYYQSGKTAKDSFIPDFDGSGL